MPESYRKKMERRLSEYYTAKLRAKAWVVWEPERRSYCLRAEGVPAHESMRSMYPDGVSVIDHIPPAKARELMGYGPEPEAPIAVEAERRQTFTAPQETAVIELLWNSLKLDPEHRDRRKTGWGTKTKIGLVSCIERIAKGDVKSL